MTYDELDDAAKECAREWWRNLEAETWSYDRAPDYYEDMATCLSHLGIEVSQKGVKHVRGEHTWWTTEWGFQWSGFWSQGDGLVIDGDWAAERVDMDKLREHAPQDDTLTTICAGITGLMLRWPLAKAQINLRHYGPGLPGMVIEEAWVNPDAHPGFNDDDEMPEEDQRILKDLIERACEWCYDQLESYYESDTGDEAAEEAIRSNGYEFDEEGEFEPAAHA